MVQKNKIHYFCECYLNPPPSPAWLKIQFFGEGGGIKTEYHGI